jgi:AraC family transcriptional regulator
MLGQELGRTAQSQAIRDSHRPSSADHLETLYKERFNPNDLDLRMALDERRSEVSSFSPANTNVASLEHAVDTKIHLARGGLSGWQLRAITSYIGNRIAQKITLADLAAVAKLSEGYLCRAFAASLNCSPMRFVVAQRVEMAKTLLRRGSSPLCQIALECGFADQAHFTRVFGALIGETPRRWRLAQSFNDIQTAFC